MGRLSVQSKRVQNDLRALPPQERAEIVSLEIIALAAEVLGAAPTAAPHILAKAVAALTKRVTENLIKNAGGEIKRINGYKAVVGQITVKGQQLDTILSEGSFNKSRSDQNEYAGQFGGDRPYRMATREENRAYVKGLLAKEKNNTINKAEQNALKNYRGRYVRDTAGGLVVDGRRVVDFSWDDCGYPCFGALFVRASAELK